MVVKMPEYSNIEPSPCPEQCKGCGHQKPDETCHIYAFPAMRWTGLPCPMATHRKKEDPKQPEKPLNPIKASKRKMGK
jgi:hypothetical protein